MTDFFIFAYTYSTFAWSPLSASPTAENQTHFVFLDIQIFTPTLIWVCALLLLLYWCNSLWNKSNCCLESLCNPVQQSDVEELIISFETIMQFPLWTRETSLTGYTSYIFFSVTLSHSSKIRLHFYSCTYLTY